MHIPPEEWFQLVNREFRAQNMDARHRPFLALDRYCKDFNVRALSFDSAPAKRIFEWFYANTKPTAHHIGSMFTGTFFYDSCFWAVDIPVGYGQFNLEAPNCLRSMSASIKEGLMSSPPDVLKYALLWVDCLDYCYGFDDIQKTFEANSFGFSLLNNADRELRTAVAQLLEHHPNSKASMSSRMAVEIYLKAFLVLKAGFPETQVKALNHRLGDILEKCEEVATGHDILKIKNELTVFPAIHDRYTGKELPSTTLWQAYGIAQYVAASVVRTFTDRDSRAQLRRPPNVL